MHVTACYTLGMGQRTQTGKELKMKIKATFYTMTGNVYKEGIYQTMKQMRRARDRYEMAYGACLRCVTVEIVA